eukprot:6415457-Pyramimonas_sp.AAC.1
MCLGRPEVVAITKLQEQEPASPSDLGMAFLQSTHSRIDRSMARSGHSANKTDSNAPTERKIAGRKW